MTDRLTEQSEAQFRRELERLLRQGARISDDALRALLTRFAALRRTLRLRAINSESWQRDLDRILEEIDDIVTQAAADIQRIGLQAHRTAWAHGTQTSQALIQIGAQIPGGVNYPFFLQPAPRPGFRIRAPTRAVVLEAVHRGFTFSRIVAVTTEMMAEIRAVVIASFIGQLSPFEAMVRITHIVGIRDLPGFRKLGTTGISAKGERILRTELMTAENLASFDVMRDQLGRFPDLQKVWLATGDNRTRDSHLEAHGQVKPVDQPFTVGGAEGMYPHDPTLPIGERANCRCRSVPYREEWGTVDDIVGELNDQVAAEIELRAEEGVRVLWRDGRIVETRRLARAA